MKTYRMAVLKVPVERIEALLPKGGDCLTCRIMAFGLDKLHKALGLSRNWRLAGASHHAGFLEGKVFLSVESPQFREVSEAENMPEVLVGT